jgi:predicted RNase H-like HicB family nuclease
MSQVRRSSGVRPLRITMGASSWAKMKRSRHVAATEHSYTAVCRRLGDWWAISVPELRGVHTQARTLDEAADMARDAIALMLDIDVGAVDVSVEPM